MTEQITEWEWTADVKSWIDQILADDPRLPFKEAKCEQRGAGSLKRRDLSLLNKSGKVVLTGEVKLPYQADGGSPYIEKVVQDAYKKAAKAGASFFFTWNVNEFVLWETDLPKALKDRKYKSWKIVNVVNESRLTNPLTENAIKDWLSDFLKEFAVIIRAGIAQAPPDDKFIDVLESFLARPIHLTIEELSKRYGNVKFKAELDKWMREEQGWTISDDPGDIRDNLERAAKFACYALVNKLVFYEALLKRYGARMEKLSVDKHIDTGDGLRGRFLHFFEEAKRETGDYETVFGEKYLEDIGERIPFYSDLAVSHWRELVGNIHQWDFTKLEHEIIGRIFERLISPGERHKYGQHYTRPEVVDLINSFCIRDGDAKVIDPACGGGTFLVRAYARKKELSRRKHKEILSDLYGVDISHFATHLTTINLATRDLIDEENYPQIARSDFFDIMPDRRFIMLPNHAKGARVRAKGLGAYQEREVVIHDLDAVVGNPPYVRQEEIKSKKETYARLIKDEWHGLKLSGRSDLHCYFWPHATTFLKENGYFGFLTSSQWLDVEYGFKLQEWILKNFELLAVLESIDEPWFIGARVVTAVTILRRQPDERKRMENIVRFVQLRRPIAEILMNDGTTPGQINAADDFRDEILGLRENEVNERYRARLVPQKELWESGVNLGAMLGKGGADDEEEKVEAQAGEYYGGKWGLHLRAPDLWFELLDETGGRWSNLGDLAEVRFGVKSGKDSFFYPIDFSGEALNKIEDPAEFEDTYGVPRKEVKSGQVKLVLCGEGRGEVRAIEAQYLEPEVHSLMEIDGFTVSPEDCSRQILLVGKKKKELKGTYVLDYINWGESQGYHKGSTCASREGETKTWYDLTGHNRGQLFWPMAQQYKHAIPVNEHDLICNHNLFDIYCDKQDMAAYAGILNSSFVVLSKHQFGRPVGVEGNLKTEVVDVNMMLVPDPRKATKKQLERIEKAFNKMKDRKALYFLSERRLKEMAYTQAGKLDELKNLSDVCELDMPDRRELDDAVLEMLGISSKGRRDEIIEELYGYLREFYELTRQKEEKAIANKNRSKRRGPAKPGEIAAQILAEINEKEPKWLRRYDDFVNKGAPYDVYDIPEEGASESHMDMVSGHYVKFKSRGKSKIVETKNEAQSNLIQLLADSGVRGLVPVPHEKTECQSVRDTYHKFIKDRDTRLGELIEERTADEDVQEKIFDLLLLSVRKGTSY